MARKALVVALGIVVALWTMVGAARAETVILQSGLDKYTGCTTRTIEHLRPATSPDDGTFALRGSQRSLQVKFALPADLADKRLARARLFVFLPEARNPNTFLEIFCHEVISGGRQPAIDEVTDYDNGRRAGAVDSVELFAPPGDGWPNFPFLPRGLPEGGKWISFNVTPLAERWLKDPSSNHGVLLMPTDSPDVQRPSTWEIDIPTQGFEQADVRPYLSLELAPLSENVLVAMTHPLWQICDRSTRYGYRGGYDRQYRLAMAGNEYEGFQVVVYPMLADLRNVRFTWTNLATQDGHTIPAANLEYFLVDWYRLRRNWMTSAIFYSGKLYDLPDPLLPGRAVAIRRQVHTPFYFRVHTAPDTAPGVYRGTISLQADGITPQSLAVEVRVWPYRIPARWNFHTMGQLVWGNIRRFHGLDGSNPQADAKLLRRYYDFCLDHRFAPTEQYGQILSPRADLEYCLSRGMNTIYLSGDFTGSDKEMQRLLIDYRKLKDLRVLDYALVYIGDETDKWDDMRRRANLAHAYLPGVQVMIGGSVPREELDGYIDIYDPQIGGDSPLFSLQQSSATLIEQSRRRGEQFYWYVAAGPSYPLPNVQVEYPLIDSRLLFWMTWKYSVTGFEYYCYNIWNRNYDSDRSRRFPAVPWRADGWDKGWPSNGDGMLFYPGPISSLRFEAIRDGIEDWESHLVLSDCLAALRHAGVSEDNAELVGRAEGLLRVDPGVVAGFSKYTQSPARLLAARDLLGRTISEAMTAIDQKRQVDPQAWTYEQAAQDRTNRECNLRRQMLWQRHIRACEALGVEALTLEQWNALWPEAVTAEPASPASQHTAD
jgi:hypothetical protein